MMTSSLFARTSFAALIVLGFVMSFEASALTNPTSVRARISKMKTFDGQIMSCETPENIGQVAYRITQANGVVQDGEVAITVKLETMKCTQTANGLDFVKSDISGAVPNASNGFIAFKNLEYVTYTTDLKVVQAAKLDLNAAEHTAVFRAPISAFPGFYRRNVSENREFRAVMIGFLRGTADVGSIDRLTGKVTAMHTGSTAFGSFTVTLSSANNTLSFPPPIQTASSQLP